MKEVCYHCRVGKIEVPELETSDKTYAYCPYCGAVRLFYEPQDYQKEFHTDDTMIKANFGGYGSGKSTSSMAELLDHAFQTPNGMACCVAPTVRQLEQTVKKEFFRQCPDRLIESYRVKDSEVVLTNGFSFLFYVADSPVKIRSLNLTALTIKSAV